MSSPASHKYQEFEYQERAPQHRRPRLRPWKASHAVKPDNSQEGRKKEKDPGYDCITSKFGQAFRFGLVDNVIEALLKYQPRSIARQSVLNGQTQEEYSHVNCITSTQDRRGSQVETVAEGRPRTLPDGSVMLLSATGTRAQKADCHETYCCMLTRLVFVVARLEHEE